MTSLGNGNYNSRSMNGLTQIYANDINCDTISTIDANIGNKLTVVGDVDIGTDLNVAGISNLSQTNATTLNVSGNVDISGSLNLTNAIIQTTGTPSNILRQTTFTGTDPIYVVPNAPVGATNVSSAIFLTDNAVSGRGGFINQVASGLNFISVGVNAFPFGNRVDARAGAVIRFDTRDSGVNFNDPIASFRIWKRNASNTQVLALAIYEIERIINYLDTQFQRKLLINELNVGTGRVTEISKVGADLQIEGIHNSSTLKVVNRNASGVISTTFQNSTTATDITSTTINLNGNVILSANSNLTLSGTGFISQTGTGVNSLTAASFTATTASTSTSTGALIVAGGVGIGGAVNIAGSATLSANSNLTLSGTGIISQTGTGVNSLTAASFTATTASTSTASGALTVAGGVGIGGAVNVGGTLTIHDTVAAKTSTISKSGNDLIIAGANNSSEFKVNNKSTIGSTATTFTSTFASTTVNSVNGLTNSQGLLTHPDGTAQRSIYINNCLNDATFHSFISGKDIKQTTFSFLEASLATVTISTGRHFFVAVQTIEGQEYNGVGILATTAGSWEVALYASGTTPARLAISSAATTTADVMTYIDFQGSYLELSTEIRYIAFRTTTSSPTQGIIARNSVAARSNYGKNTMTDSKLDKRAQSYANTGAFPDPIPTAQVMTNEAAVFYAVLY